METKIWEGQIEIPTYCLGEEDPFPPFQRQGDDAIYPYTMLDDLTDHRIVSSYHAVFLENEYLLVTVLPELGGRIYSVYDKIAKREVFYKNNVIKPALIALRGAWISGGVEFNFPKGHSTTTVSPILYKLKRYPDGSASVVVGNRERVSGMKWLVEIKLYPDRAYIETNISLFNPSPFPHRFYFWSNAAVPAHEKMQFIYPATSAYYGSTTVSYPINDGVDLSWYINHKFAVDLFAKDCKDDFFCAYDHSADFGIVHFASRYEAVGKKFFTWGCADDGLIWAEILSDGDGPYCEIQSGRFIDQSTYDFLLPHFRESWQELWYPVRGIKGLVKANDLIAVNLQKEDGHITLGVYSTLKLPEAYIFIDENEKRIYGMMLPLSPKKPLLLRLPYTSLAPSTLTLRVVVFDNKVLTYTTSGEEEQKEKIVEGVQAERKTSEILYLNGLDKERFNMKKHAEQLYLKALEEDEGFSLAHLALGRLYLEKGLFEKSEGHLKKALRRNPHCGPAHYYLGLLYKFQERYNDAKESLWSVRDAEFLPLSFYTLGEIALREGDYSAAVSFFYKAMDMKTGDIRTLGMLAATLRKEGSNDIANDILDMALQIDPLDSLALFEKYLLRGEEEFRERLRRGKGLPSLLPNGEIGFTFDSILAEADDYLDLARIYMSSGLWDEAIKVLEEYFKERDKVYPLIYYYLGYLFDKKGRKNRAKKFFSIASKEKPEFVFPNELETINVLNTALEYNPRDYHALYYLGNLFYALGREEEAIEVWEKSAKGLEYPVLYRNLALGYKATKADYKRAIELYMKAIQICPNWRLYLELDRLLEERGETVKRLELLLSAPEAVRAKTQIVARLAEVYLELGEYDKTIELIMSHTFRPWEGEVKMRQIYYRAFVGRGKKLFEEGKYEEAAESFSRALEYPRNIGVGKPYNAKDEEAKEWLEKTLNKLEGLREE